jgi:hypothetical protein
MENWRLGELPLLLAPTKSKQVVDILLKIENI